MQGRARRAGRSFARGLLASGERVVLAGTIAAGPVERRTPSEDEVTEIEIARPVPGRQATAAAPSRRGILPCQQRVDENRAPGNLLRRRSVSETNRSPAARPHPWTTSRRRLPVEPPSGTTRRPVSSSTTGRRRGPRGVSQPPREDARRRLDRGVLQAEIAVGVLRARNGSRRLFGNRSFLR